MAHVAPWKEEMLKELKDLISAGPVVGIVAVDGIPGPQLQNMRRGLRKGSPFIVSKNTLIRLAIEEMDSEKSGLKDLLEHIGQTQNGLIVSKKNSFKLFAELKATESQAPAKGGETATEDIMVKAGDTPFKPGPIVGELQKAGVPAAIMSGKVVIKKDKVLVKAGDTISADIAGALTRLEIFPITVGLKLKSAYEDGTVFGSDILDVDPLVYRSQIIQVASGGFNLAMHIAYATPMTMRPLLTKAHMDAFNLAMNAEVFNSATIDLLISKAQVQMLALASHLEDGLDDDLAGMVRNRPAAPPPGDDGAEQKEAEEKKEEKPEEEAVSEEEAAAGLGALFG